MLPEPVVNVLATQPGSKRGSRLLMLDRLERVIQLLPQVLSTRDGELVARLLKEQFPSLYGSRRVFTITELVNMLEIDAGRLQALLRSVDDDVPMFVSEEDEFEVTQYRMSDAFRRYLGETFGVEKGLWPAAGWHTAGVSEARRSSGWRLRRCASPDYRRGIERSRNRCARRLSWWAGSASAS